VINNHLLFPLKLRQNVADDTPFEMSRLACQIQYYLSYADDTNNFATSAASRSSDAPLKLIKLYGRATLDTTVRGHVLASQSSDAK
jgi:hypothetical protein